MLRWFRRSKPVPQQSGREALLALRAHVEQMNIPVVADDFDAGYDMAIDEVLVLIERALNPDASDDDVTYGDNE